MKVTINGNKSQFSHLRYRLGTARRDAARAVKAAEKAERRAHVGLTHASRLERNLATIERRLKSLMKRPYRRRKGRKA